MVSIPNSVLGEAAKVFVVPRTRDATGLTERVASFGESRMAPHHLTKQIVILSARSKSSAGKVMKAV